MPVLRWNGQECSFAALLDRQDACPTVERAGMPLRCSRSLSLLLHYCFFVKLLSKE
ncbi:MAG: hypothetical protein SXA11_09610 [Cyanobacteriota bacterium]|nr:hypothetical protein [Cyanobacteriota bacterium]